MTTMTTETDADTLYTPLVDAAIEALPSYYEPVPTGGRICRIPVLDSPEGDRLILALLDQLEYPMEIIGAVAKLLQVESSAVAKLLNLCFICEAAPAKTNGVPCCQRCADTHPDDELIRRDMQRRIAKSE